MGPAFLLDLEICAETGVHRWIQPRRTYLCLPWLRMADASMCSMLR